MKLLITIVILYYTLSFSQLNEITRFPFEVSNNINFLEINNNILSFWEGNDKVWMSRSSNGGIDWETPLLLSLINNPNNYISGIKAYKTSFNRIILLFKNGPIFLIYSDDNGNTWSEQTNIELGTPITNRTYSNFNLFEHDNGLIEIFYSRGNINDDNYFSVYINTSNDSGLTWSSQRVFNNIPINPSIYFIDSLNKVIFYEDSSKIKFIKTTDNGFTWTLPQFALNTLYDEAKPKVIKKENEIYLFFEHSIPILTHNIYQKEIAYVKSTDNGITWSSIQYYSRYKGPDYNISLANIGNNNLLISFFSDRYINNKLLYGFESSIESITPPYIVNYSTYPMLPSSGENVFIRTVVDDNYDVNDVFVHLNKNYIKIDSVQMFDDGLHGDSLAFDGIYGASIGSLYDGELVLFNFSALNDSGAYTYSNGGEVSVPIDNGSNQFYFDINKIKLPLNNTGVLADVNILPYGTLGKYDDIGFLFSGGFLLGGLLDTMVWLSGSASAILLKDFVPGKVNGSVYDPKNIIHTVHSDDAAFGESWQNWKYAVMQGADFYDGDGDGIYNPVDLNNNGIWDINEDAPGTIGDLTAFTVFNDGVHSQNRRFQDTYPLGIEIQQTLFGLKWDHTIFIRYRIINYGNEELLNPVYFGLFTDPDIGALYQNDLAGTDTLNNSVFAYKSRSDTYYGNNPPAFYTSIVQGPYSYIQGETFIDVNGNGTYDIGIDTPLDSAINNKGILLGTEFIEGAKNIGLTSGLSLITGFGWISPNKYSYFNTLNGKDFDGNYFNPCATNYGNVFGGLNCEDVNPLYLFSGDPVTKIGWINTQPWDQRLLANSGPFTLYKNKPVDIIVAYTVNRGIDTLNSITVTKERAQYSFDYYKSNFSVKPPVNVEDNILLPKEFHLYQNYPNPFNPTTNISFVIPINGKVSLKVYDILGRVVKTLLNNEEKSAGKYEVTLDASQFSSGVYFYRLQSGSFISTKKMVLLK